MYDLSDDKEIIHAILVYSQVTINEADFYTESQFIKNGKFLIWVNFGKIYKRTYLIWGTDNDWCFAGFTQYSWKQYFPRTIDPNTIEYIKAVVSDSVIRQGPNMYESSKYIA